MQLLKKVTIVLFLKHESLESYALELCFEPTINDHYSHEVLMLSLFVLPANKLYPDFSGRQFIPTEICWY